MVENHHRKMSGYRDLTEEEIATINEIKDLEIDCAVFAGYLKSGVKGNGVDMRELALARTHLEQGFMHLVKAVAQPDTPWV